MAQPITDVAADLPTVRAEHAGAPYDPEASLSAELDRQVDAYVASGVAALTGLAEETFRDRLEPLRALLDDVPAAPSDWMEPTDHVPFVVVLSPDTHDLNDAVPAMRRGARRGVSVIDRDEAATYRPIDGVEPPEGFAYLLTGIDTGSEFC